MSQRYNTQGVSPSGGKPTPIPEAEYVLKIIDAVEGHSKKGDYQVTVDFKVDSGEYLGRTIKFHRVTFFNAKGTDGKENPGAGMAVHFLKTIGEPWQGNIEINPLHWLNRKLKAKVIQEEYNGYTNNKIAWVEPLETSLPTSANTPVVEMEEVPF